MSGIIALTVGFSGVAFAGTNYFPPERIHCTLSPASKLSCSDFNRQYLTENTYTADLETGKEIVLNFASGVAFTESANRWSVFYTYKTTNNKMVKLKQCAIYCRR